MSEAKKWSLESLPTPTDVEMAFPCTTVGFLPTMEEINSTEGWESEWRKPRKTWEDYVARLFFCGGKLPGLKESLPGVSEADARKVLRIVKLVLGGFDTKHEHKESGCAWILSRYFRLPEVKQ